MQAPLWGSLVTCVVYCLRAPVLGLYLFVSVYEARPATISIRATANRGEVKDPLQRKITLQFKIRGVNSLPPKVLACIQGPKTLHASCFNNGNIKHG